MSFRMRCREKYSDEELARIYASPHDHSQFPDHKLRVKKTFELANRYLTPEDVTAADLSCGNGAILRYLPHVQTRYYGDYAPGYQYHGPIEETIFQIPNVDVFILCETLEHLDDPDLVLRRIRMRAKKLILSCPLMRWWDENPEHYWAFDRKAIKGMLICLLYTSPSPRD